MQNGIDTLEDSLAISYNDKYSLTVVHNNCSPKYLLKWIENICPYKNLSTDICCSFIHNSKKLERDVHQWVLMDEKIGVPPYGGTFQQ